MPLSGSSRPTIVLNSVVLPTPLGPMTPTMPLRGSVNDRSLISDPAVEALVEVVDLDDDAAQARAGRDLDLLEVELAGLLRLGGHLLVAPQARLALGLPGLGARAHPGELLRQPLLQLLVLAALDGEPLGLLLQVGRVVALVRVGAAAVEFEDPLGDVVEEVPVVGDGQDGALVVGEVLLEPQHALGVEVVGRLVEQQQVGLGQQQLAQRHAAPLATGQVGDRLVGRRAAQRVHRLLELRVEVPGVGGVDLLLQLAHLLHQLVGVVGGHQLGDLVVPVELRLDRPRPPRRSRGRSSSRRAAAPAEDADRGAGREEGVAVVGLVEPGHDLQDARLAGPVRTDDADLRAGKEVQGDVVEDDLVAVRLADLLHRVDEFGHAVCNAFLVSVLLANHPRRGHRQASTAPSAPRPRSRRDRQRLGVDALRPTRRPRRRLVRSAASFGFDGFGRSTRAMLRARSGPTAVARTSTDDRRLPSRSSYSLV